MKGLRSKKKVLFFPSDDGIESEILEPHKHGLSGKVTYSQFRVLSGYCSCDNIGFGKLLFSLALWTLLNEFPVLLHLRPYLVSTA